MIYDLSKINELIEQGYIRSSTKNELSIYCYTEKCTYEQYWNEYTNACRGLILNNKTGEVIAKPFPKFHNLGSHSSTYIDNLPNEPYTVSEKIDGSLGIVYFYNNRWNVATKGSFNSEQSIVGEKLLKKYDTTYLRTDCTFLVEIIYPANKIVVDYKGEEKLVLLGAYNTQTEEEIIFEKGSIIAGIELARQYNYTIKEMVALQKTLPKDQEGFVVRFNGGLRVKIKGDEYLRVHKIVTNMSPLSFWEVMEDGKVPEFYIQQIPEEFNDDFDPIIKRLEQLYNSVKKEVIEEFESLPTKDTTPEARKQVGLYLKLYSFNHGPAMFPMLNGKKDLVDNYIMKSIRPTGNYLNL